MFYGDYKAARDLAWRVLINENIHSLPINTSRLCRGMGIVVRLYDPEDENSGCSCFINGVPNIFVSRSEPVLRQRFTAAHELGHILLGHVGKYELVNREPSDRDNPIEQAANVFAVRLLAPACVLWGCNVDTADEITDICGISRTAAEFRLKRMKELYKRGKFLLSPLERRVFEQFKGFIEEYKRQHD